MQGSMDSALLGEIIDAEFIGNAASVAGGAIFIEGSTDIEMYVMRCAFVNNIGVNAALDFQTNSTGTLALQNSNFSSSEIYSQINVRVANLDAQGAYVEAQSACALGSYNVTAFNSSSGIWTVDCKPCSNTQYQLAKGGCIGRSCPSCDSDATCYGVGEGGNGAPISANEG